MTTNRPFKERLAEVLRGLLEDGIDEGGARVWCHWSPDNKVSVNPRYQPANNMILHGLVSLKMIRRIRVRETLHWKKYGQNRWIIPAGNHGIAYAIVDEKKLSKLKEKAPARTMKEWTAFVRSHRPPVNQRTTDIDAAIKAVMKSADESPQPAAALARAIQSLAGRLKRVLQQ